MEDLLPHICLLQRTAYDEDGLFTQQTQLQKYLPVVESLPRPIRCPHLHLPRFRVLLSLPPAKTIAPHQVIFYTHHLLLTWILLPTHMLTSFRRKSIRKRVRQSRNSCSLTAPFRILPISSMALPDDHHKSALRYQV